VVLEGQGRFIVQRLGGGQKDEHGRIIPIPQ
jgi:hypothetical protein